MNKHRSFMPSDFRFSFRFMFLFLVVFIVLSVISIGLGLMVETIPEFWRGFLCGVGLGLLIPSVLLFPKKEIDIASFPEPSENVKTICDDPNCSLVEAVKIYCEETGVGLSEATAVLRAYMAKRQLKD